MSKPLYRVGNWSEYNRSLKQRGSLTLWLSERVVEQWSHQGLPTARGAVSVFGSGHRDHADDQEGLWSASASD